MSKHRTKNELTRQKLLSAEPIKMTNKTETGNL